MSNPPDPQPPNKLGRYQLLERIAVGGMAEVYKAVALGLSGFEKTVVVKRLLPQHQRDQELLTMFVDEARLLGRMRHPNIAEVYDIDHEGNEFFFALEYVDGVELRELLGHASTLSDGESVWVTSELAKALGYAHGLLDDEGKPLGIVHRDISPSNVLIAQSGAVKLVDFGVAKWRSQRSETRHGVLKGKVNYMSPEQCRGEPLDSRSDVFALGVLLYEMSVGCKPFERTSDFETLKAIAEGHFIKPSAKRRGYPVALEALCVSMMELDRKQRPPHMGAVIAALQGYATSAGLELGPGSLTARAANAARRRTPCVQLAPGYGNPNTGQVVRLPADRTATAASTMQSAITAVTAVPKPITSSGSRLSTKLKLSFGVVALALGAALVAAWLRPLDPVRVGARPDVLAAPRLPTFAAAPPQTATGQDAQPASSARAPLTNERKPASKASTATVARQRTPPLEKPRSAPTIPSAAAPSEAKTPPSTAVWDPDSPVPP